MHHPGPFTVEANVADLMALLGSRRAVLVGHSLGGVIVLAAAARHPESIAGAVVFEPPMSWEPWWPGSTAGSAARAYAGDPEDTAEVFMRRLIGDARWDELPERTRTTRRSEGRALVAELHDLRNVPWRGADVVCPVIVGVSEHARGHHRRATEEIAAQVPGARLVELDDCHHDAHTRAPAQFADRLVRPLLERLGPRPDP